MSTVPVLVCYISDADDNVEGDFGEKGSESFPGLFTTGKKKEW